MRPEAPRARLRPADLLGEALAALSARPARAALTALGTVLGVAVLTAVLGLTATAQTQVSKRFDALASTEITVRQLAGGEVAFPADADQRVGAITGVSGSGVTWTVGSDSGLQVSAFGPWNATEEVTEQILVDAASPGLLGEAGAVLHSGRTLDRFHEQHKARVAVVGVGVARQLGLADISHPTAVFLDGIPFTVIGIVADTRRHPEILTRVLIPTSTAKAIWPARDMTMYVSTALGAPPTVGRQLGAALRPDLPDGFQIQLPLDPRSLRDQVSTDLAVLFALLAGVCLIVGVVGIANTTLVSVLERVSEIGLRRSLGALPRHITAQFLLESTLLGALGGLVGAGLGTITVLLVALNKEWTAVLPPAAALSGPLIGAVAGLVAGGYPALRAARIEPAAALRS